MGRNDADVMLSVAIAIEIPGESGAAAPIVSTSCEAAVGAGRCPVARNLNPSSVVAWYAVVRSDDGTGLHLRIELRDRSAVGVLVETRDLVFSDRDKPESRWASVGAVVAALVAARDSTERGQPFQQVPEAPVQRGSDEPPVPWGFDVAAVTGPALDRGPFRFGGLVRGFVGLPRTPGVIGVLSIRYAQRPGDLDLAWVSGSAGIGARVGDRGGAVSFEILGELVYERMFISGRNAATGHESTSSLNRFGGRLGLDFAVRARSGLALVVGAEASALRPSVDISFLDERVGREPLIGFALTGGLRYSR